MEKDGKDLKAKMGILLEKVDKDNEYIKALSAELTKWKVKAPHGPHAQYLRAEHDRLSELTQSCLKLDKSDEEFTKERMMMLEQENQMLKRN